MPTFQVGDTVILCASLKDFCGSNLQYYFINDINIGITCDIHTSTSDCLPFSGVPVDFQWTRESSHLCEEAGNLKLLGSATTDNNGVASLTYTITQSDIDLYTANPISFDMRVCIRETQHQNIISETRNNTIYHTGDNIILGCLPICYGLDLYNTKYDSVTQTCIKDTLNAANSPLCTVAGATHLIEYDISFLPQNFLGLVSSNISIISSGLGTVLPTISGMTYLESKYSQGKFGIFISYAPQLSMAAANVDNIIASAGSAIAGIVIMLISLRLFSFLGVYSLAASIIFGVIGAVAVSFKIFDIIGGSSSDHTATEPTPKQRLAIIQETIDQVIATCNTNYPGCSSNPPVAPCDTNQMRLYSSCMASAGITLSKMAGDVTGINPDGYELIKICYKFIDDGLAAGTLTADQAKTALDSCFGKAKDDMDKAKDAADCVSGYTYDKTQLKCIANSTDCWLPISNSCLLTGTTGKKIITVGVLGIIGYIILKRITK